MPDLAPPEVVPPLVLADLSSRASLSVEGSDGPAFLHSLVTNDVASLAVGRGRPACLLSPKGKLRATFTILRVSPDRLLLDADPGLRESLAGMFAPYAAFHRGIAIRDEGPGTSVLHVAGSGAGVLLGELGAAALPAGAGANAVARLAGTGALVVAASRGAGPGWDLRLAVDEAPAVLAALRDGGLLPSPADRLEPGRIAAGLPRWGADLDESVLPDEAGLTSTHVSYTKGCYVGQETVARLKTYGHVNRRLVVLSFSPGARVRPGDRLAAGDEEVGKVTSASEEGPRGRPVGLGWVRRGHEAPGTPLHAAGDGDGSRGEARVESVVGG